ncbi:hypothetical protein ACFOG5_14965 [Pedobacter fastidiosus]|uniref:YcxB-like protein n=1 Tax=Pedobacter fastidiosus TaxID=2765361 RepID=A0ABR7KUR4_9SPHI|nr:hypothetical protein [Pedobacter fastidiosus]MBC6111775.1 hypothetical protein [Pedobacter fastidiosus]
MIQYNFIENTTDFVERDLSFKKLIRKHYSTLGNLRYFGGIGLIILFLVGIMPWFIFHFHASFLLLLLPIIPIIYLLTKKNWKENYMILEKQGRRLGFSLHSSSFDKKDFWELKYRLLASYFDRHNGNIEYFELFYEDFIANYPIKKYKWYSLKPVSWLLALVITTLIGHFSKDQLINKDISLAIEICLRVIILIPFIEFNLFKLPSDIRNSKNLDSKRFLQEFKVRYFIV